MKKILIAFLLLFVPFMVYAVEATDYTFAWNAESSDIELAYTFDYKDGYLFVDYDSQVKFSMSYYDKKGNFLKSKKINDIVIKADVKEYIYLFIVRQVGNTEAQLIAQAYNEKLELVNESILIDVKGIKAEGSSNIIGADSPADSDNLIKVDGQLIRTLYKIGDLSFLFKIDDGKIYTYGANIDMSSIDSNIDPDELEPEEIKELLNNAVSLEKRIYKEDLSSYESEKIDTSGLYDKIMEIEQAENPEEKMAEYAMELLGIDELPFMDLVNLEDRLNLSGGERILDTNIYDDYLVVALSGVDSCGEEIEYYRGCIRVYDRKTLNILFQKRVNPYTKIGKIVDGYLMIVDNEPESDLMGAKIISTLQIYDLKTEKLLREIKGDNKTIVDIEDTKRGFVLNKTTCEATVIGQSNTSSGKILPSYLVAQKCGIIRDVYHYYKTVETKVTSGKGQIIVDENQTPNTPVKFTIIPEKGYVLSEVKVTDANGNVLVFTDYTFTMPDANVLIEAVFITNPNTSSFISYLVIVLGGIAFITTYLLIQKKKALKIKW